MAVNVCQLSTQTQAKEEIYKKWKSKYEDEIMKIDLKIKLLLKIRQVMTFRHLQINSKINLYTKRSHVHFEYFFS